MGKLRTKKESGKRKKLSEILSFMANEDDDGEKSRGLHQQIANKPKTQIVIGVPSYQEVFESSQTKSTPPSFFKPSQSFSQAFAFVKSSDVYSPPPPSSSAAASSSQPPGASQVPSTRCYMLGILDISVDEISATIPKVLELLSDCTKIELELISLYICNLWVLMKDYRLFIS